MNTCPAPCSIQLQEQDEPFLRSVMELGDKHAVVTTRAIFGANNVKLLEPGTTVNSRLLVHLIEHVLDTPIERCLSVDGCVCLDDIEEGVVHRMTEDIRFSRIAHLCPIETLLLGVRSMPLPNPMAFNLTIAREQRPYLYEHSLDVAAMSVYLQALTSQSAEDLGIAAACGMFLDLGILHIPAHVLASDGPLSSSDRRYLYAHPVMSSLICQQCPELPAKVGIAISQHHERLDGSGYPSGLVGKQISALGKILMLADATAALLRQSSAIGGGVSLRMQRQKYDSSLLEWADRLFVPNSNHPSEDAATDLDRLSHELYAIAETLELWAKTFGESSTPDIGESGGMLMQLIQRRISLLRRTLAEAGFVSSQLSGFADLAKHDERSAAEILELAGEAMWQLKEVTHEARRHWDDASNAKSDLRPILGWIKFAETRLNLLQ